MIDPTTGDLALVSGSGRIGARLTRSQFLASTLGKRARGLIANAPWMSYSLEVPANELAPFSVSLTLVFRDESLSMVDILNSELGTDWGDWSTEREEARRLAHDAWLASMGVSAKKYRWGTVWSGFDAKTGGSSVVINYDKKESRWPWRS